MPASCFIDRCLGMRPPQLPVSLLRIFFKTPAGHMTDRALLNQSYSCFRRNREYLSHWVWQENVFAINLSCFILACLCSDEENNNRAKISTEAIRHLVFSFPHGRRTRHPIHPVGSNPAISHGQVALRSVLVLDLSSMHTRNYHARSLSW